MRGDRRSGSAVRGLVGAAALFVTAAACRHFDHHTAVDVAMSSAYRPDILEFDDRANKGFAGAGI